MLACHSNDFVDLSHNIYGRDLNNFFSPHYIDRCVDMCGGFFLRKNATNILAKKMSV